VIQPAETSAVETLSVTTSRFEGNHALLDLLDNSQPLYLKRAGRTLVGIGEAMRAEFSGPNRFGEASRWWSELTKSAQITDEVGVPGSGLVGFAQFTFSGDSHYRSAITIPRLIIGSDSAGSWLTRIGTDESTLLSPETSAASPVVTWAEDADNRELFLRNVHTALSRVNNREVHKVVLARELTGTSDTPIDVRHLVRNLETAYPHTHVFAMSHLVGASPETLASIRDGQLSATVLAGSTSRGANPDDDLSQAAALAQSTKDLDEHEYAVSSAVQSLSGAGFTPVVADHPRTMKLKNLWHLATDIRAEVPNGLNAFDVLGTMHPTAAVAGTPTQAALDLIAELESFDRGYFGGPVGWCDAHGNAEFAIALRCAQLSEDRHTIVAHAGAGVVADSVAEKELLETELKFAPIVDACST
jgi:menaquinone-specific isochorismate synthase